MRTSALTSKLIEHRARLTGESSHALRRWAQDLDHTLTTDETTALLEAVRHPSPTLDETPKSPLLPRDLRQRVFPDAQTQAQRELETGVLHALARVGNHLAHHPRAWTYRLDQMITSIHPEPDSLRVQLDPRALGPLLAELLPLNEDGYQPNPEVYGTAGARARWEETRKSGRLELSLADQDAAARVVVTGVRAREWNAAKEYLHAERPAVLNLNNRFPHALSPSEAARLRPGRLRFYLPVRLASALLRRVKLFGNSWTITVNDKGPDSVDFAWDGGLSVEDALRILCHPATQVAHDTFAAAASPLGDGQGIINDLDTRNDMMRARKGGGGQLVLKRRPKDHPHWLGSHSDDMAQVWHRWESAYRTRPRRSSLRFNDLITLRCDYTGETEDSAHRCIERLDGETDSTVVNASLIPEAHSLSQRILETSLLLAIRDCTVLVSSSLRRGFHQPFLAVSPRENRLVAELNPAVAERFFRSVLADVNPSSGGGGVPGLRLAAGQNGAVVLCLLGASGELTDAHVELKNITFHDAEQVWAEINRTTDRDYRRVDPVLDRSPELSAGERADVDDQRQLCGPVGLGSAMLRRIGLLTPTKALDVWSSRGSTEIHVETDDGPPIGTLVEALRHPIAGVTAHAEVLDTADDRHAQMRDLLPTADRFIGDLRNTHPTPALILRALPSWNEDRQQPRADLMTTRESRTQRVDWPSSRAAADRDGGDRR
ncbi:hypothetical protein ACL03H_02670 [Saccharopolyspora sp. MS10]|uniref:hypothetical protein n=1 Tax=Saccharopolyspora sp. MS10 TaxID=3385973 RepID=UPI00399F7AB6